MNDSPPPPVGGTRPPDPSPETRAATGTGGTGAAAGPAPVGGPAAVGGPAGTAAESVVFLAGWPKGVKRRRLSNRMLPVFAAAFAGVALWLVAVLAIALLARISGMPLPPLWVADLLFIAVCVGVALIGGLTAWRRRRRPSVARSQTPGRVTCIGSAGEFELDDPVPDVPFEPQLFVAFLACAPTRGAWMISIATCIAMLTVKTVWLPGAPRAAGGPFEAWAAMFVGLALGEWIWPTYFRVVPGRLDVIRFSVLRNRPIRVTKLDLKNQPVLVNWPAMALFVGDAPTPRARVSDFWIMLVPQRRRLARAVLLAAVSTHPPGPVPDDALL